LSHIFWRNPAVIDGGVAGVRYDVEALRLVAVTNAISLVGNTAATCDQSTASDSIESVLLYWVKLQVEIPA